MDINITMLNGTSHTLRVNPQDTVGSLKKLVQQRFGVPPHKQKLVFVNGLKTHLNDNSKTVCSYGLQSGSRVSLLVTEPEPIQVFLINLNGQRSTYDIKPDETVSNFKSRVRHREGVPESQQRLVYQSRDMMDDKKLADYNIQAHGIINLTTRLRSG